MNTNVDSRHEVLFYESDSVLIESLSRFIGNALRLRNPAIVFATKPHREDVAQQLSRGGFDVGDAINRGIYISLDAPEMLSTIMVNGEPDRLRFFEGLCSLIEIAAKAAKTEHPRVAICGECLGLLCAEGNMNAAIQLEEVANDFGRSHSVEMMCAYPLSAFTEDQYHGYERICTEHTAVYSC